MIRFENVDKSYNLHHQKTAKEFFHALFKQQKTIERVNALNNISFTISKNETVGIIGKNGAGKSTLLKLIAGVSAPTRGKLTVSGKVAPLIELGAGFHHELTGRENIFLNGVILGMKEKYIEERFPDIVNFAEIDQYIDTPVKYYSSGMYMRLAFSVAIFTNPDILLVDEILTVGDEKFQRKCMDKMTEFKKKGITIIYVSHEMEVVKQFCTRVIFLEKGSVKFDGLVEEGVKYYHAL